VVEVYRYDVFGQAAIQTEFGVALSASRVGNRYRFTGREYDAESGLYYYRARMYNPAIGRFMQTDPVGYGDGLNWYAYCGNNPVMFVDPYGENAIGGFVSWISGNGWDNSYDMGSSEMQQLGSAAWQGTKDGGAILGNELTFGLNSSWNKYAEEKVAEYGAVGKFSKYSAIVGREAAIMALTAGVWKGSGGSYMQVYKSSNPAHFGYSQAGKGIVHALGEPGNMKTTTQVAELFFGEAPKAIFGGPAFRSSALMATGEVFNNCFTATATAAVRSGAAFWPAAYGVARVGAGYAFSSK
jgi:RHS repeat-associated protein